MKLKKLLSVVMAVALLTTIAATTVAAADLPIDIGTPENVTVSQSGTALTVSYEIGESDKSLLKMASNSLILALAGVEKLEIGAQVDYKVDGLTDWLAEDKLISGPCKLDESLSVSVSNPALALVDWNTTTLMVRVRWAGSVKMKGESATFMNSDWSDVAYFGKVPTGKTEPSTSETEPSVTEPSATEPSVTEPSVTEPSATETEPTVTEAEPTATGAEDGIPGDANNDGLVNMKDVLTIRKYIAGIDVTINLHNADANLDDAVNLKDVLLIRKYLAGMLE